ncbi:MAG TPA: hypothetical protein PLO52_00375 [Flavobacterium alvei]|nr:hypothetical protein [Flavobacterium alvei]
MSENVRRNEFDEMSCYKLAEYINSLRSRSVRACTDRFLKGISKRCTDGIYSMIKNFTDEFQDQDMFWEIALTYSDEKTIDSIKEFLSEMERSVAEGNAVDMQIDLKKEGL